MLPDFVWRNWLPGKAVLHFQSVKCICQFNGIFNAYVIQSSNMAAFLSKNRWWTKAHLPAARSSYGPRQRERFCSLLIIHSCQRSTPILKVRNSCVLLWSSVLVEIFILLGSGSQGNTSPSRLQGTEPTITTISNFQVYSVVFILLYPYASVF